MPGHEYHTFGNQLVGNGHRLFRIAGIVADDQLDFLAQNAACGIDVLDRHFAAALELFAEGSILAGDRADGGDLDFRLGYTAGKRHQRHCGYGRFKVKHISLPVGPK